MELQYFLNCNPEYAHEQWRKNVFHCEMMGSQESDTCSQDPHSKEHHHKQVIMSLVMPYGLM